MLINKGQSREHFALENAIGGPLTGPHVKFGSISPCQHRGNSEQLKELMSAMKSRTALDDRTASVGKTNFQKTP